RGLAQPAGTPGPSPAPGGAGPGEAVAADPPSVLVEVPVLGGLDEGELPRHARSVRTGCDNFGMPVAAGRSLGASGCRGTRSAPGTRSRRAYAGVRGLRR